jgi:hypothetical protein
MFLPVFHITSQIWSYFSSGFIRARAFSCYVCSGTPLLSLGDFPDLGLFFQWHHPVCSFCIASCRALIDSWPILGQDPSSRFLFFDIRHILALVSTSGIGIEQNLSLFCFAWAILYIDSYCFSDVFRFVHVFLVRQGRVLLLHKQEYFRRKHHFYHFL